MKLVDVATDRRVTIVMFTFAIILFGFVSLSRLNTAKNGLTHTLFSGTFCRTDSKMRKSRGTADSHCS